MTGWRGQALEVDLASGQWTTLPLSPEILQRTIGGRGLAGYLLGRVPQPPRTPAFCLACGPLCGSSVETSARLVAAFSSPLTQSLFVESSGCSFASALKAAGYDALLVKGMAPHLVQLEIGTDGARLADAGHLAGLKVTEAFAGGSKYPALAIGPAGENAVLFAGLASSQGEPLERGGLGALWGRMNLKLVSAPPNSSLAQAPSAELAAADADLQRLFNASPFLRGPLGIGSNGTAALLDLTQARQLLPRDSFRRVGLVEPARFNAAALKQLPGYLADPCPGCVIACRKRDARGSLPEYDSLAHFAGLWAGAELEQLVVAIQLCQDFGLDPVSTVLTLSAYAEVEGEKLDFELVIDLVEQIATGNGEGGQLAVGSRRYLEQQQRSELVRCAKGLELPAFDPRGAWGMALALAVSPAGDYRLTQLQHAELLRKPVPVERFSFAGKARLLVQAENLIAACDSLCLCRHTAIAAGFEEYAAVLSAATGYAYSAADLADRGGEILLRERWYNQQLGFERREDELPGIFFDQVPQGAAYPQLDRTAFEAERARYYRLRGLDPCGRLAQVPELSS